MKPKTNLHKQFSPSNEYLALILAVLLNLIGTIVFSQTPLIKHLDLQPVSPVGQNWDIDQGADGLLYLANTEGLLIYDANNWLKLKMPGDIIVRTVKANASGKIFVGAYEEFGYFEINKENTWQYHSLSATIPNDISNEEIWNIEITNSKIIFQSFSKLYVYQNEIITVINPDFNFMFGNIIKDQFLLPSINQGLYILTDEGKLELLFNSPILNSTKISHLSTTKDSSSILIATQNKGLFLYVNQILTPINNEITEKAKLYEINKVCKLSTGGYAIGTLLNGVYIVDDNFEIITHCNKNTGLQNNTVLSLFEDHQKSLIVGLEKGVDLLELNTPIEIYYDNADMLGTIFTSIVFGNNLYVGTNKGVFYTKKDTLPNFQLIEGSQNQTWHLFTVNNQLFCGHNDGTYRIYEDGLFELISNRTGAWCNVPIPDLTNTWLQSNYNHMLKFSMSADTTHYIEIKGLNKRAQNFKFIDNRSFIAVHPKKGCFKATLNQEADSIIHLVEFSHENGITPDVKSYLVNTGNDEIIVSISDTNYLYNAVSNTFSKIANSERRIIFRDSQITLIQYPNYISDSNSGIILENSFTNSYYAVEKWEEQYIFCLNNAYCFYNPQQNQSNNSQKPRITAIQEDNNIQYFPSDSYIELLVQPNSNSTKLFISNFDFKHQNHIEYSFDDKNVWNRTTNSIELGGLSYGKHIVNIKFPFTGQKLEYAIIVNRPFYLSNLALIFYAILFSILVYVIIQYNNQKLKRKEEALIRENERQYKIRERELINEQLKKTLDLKSKELANSTMSIIRKNEVFEDLKEAILKLRKNSKSADQNTYQKIINLINRTIKGEEDWELFEHTFNEIHDDFFKRLIHEHPDLSPSELKLAAYLKMNLTTSEIAALFHISIRSVETKKYRLRKKLNLSGNDKLVAYMLEF